MGDEINASEEVKTDEISSEMITNDKDMRTDKDYLWSEIRKSLFQLVTDGPRHKVGQISNSNPFGANIIFRCKNGKSIAVHESIIKPHCSLFDTLSATSKIQDLYDPNGRLHISIPDVTLNILIDCLEIVYLGKTNVLLSSNNNSDDIEEIKFVLDEIFKIKWDLFNDAKEKKKDKPAKEKKMEPPKEKKKEETPREMVRNILKEVTEEAMSASDNEAAGTDLLLKRFAKV